MNNSNSNGNNLRVIITDDTLALIEYADLSFSYIVSQLTKAFPDGNMAEIIHVEIDEVLVDVDGKVYVVDNDDNVYRYDEDEENENQED